MGDSVPGYASRCTHKRAKAVIDEFTANISGQLAEPAIEKQYFAAKKELKTVLPKLPSDGFYNSNDECFSDLRERACLAINRNKSTSGMIFGECSMFIKSFDSKESETARTFLNGLFAVGMSLVTLGALPLFLLGRDIYRGARD